jgi:hypothetical protein
MNKGFFIIILITLLFVYGTRSPHCFDPKGDYNDPVIIQATKSSLIIRKDKDRNYLIDDSDIKYYTDNKNLVESFNNELKSRGLTYTPSVRVDRTRGNRGERYINPLEMYIINEIIPVNGRETRDEVRRPVIDTQNVHDTYVQKQLKSTYKTVKNDAGCNYFDEKDILNHASNLKKDTKNLGNIIKQIKDRNSSVTNFDSDNEYTILKNTWMSGNENVKEQIINNLLDCEEDKILVCPTGTTSRIIESTYIDNPENMPKTKDMFTTEMLSKASLIRNTLDSSISHLTDEEQSTILKRNIIKSYKNDYKNILSDNQINDFTKDWIDFI